MLPSEEIKQRINIVDLIGEYVPLKKAGVNFRALCPFHQEKTASFMVSPAKQIWHCFGCGLGGDIFEFIKQSEGVEFSEALRILASRAGLELKRPTQEYRAAQDQKQTLYAINEWAAKFYAAILENSSPAEGARQYLAKRGFKPETIKKWQLGFAPEDFHTFENFITKKGFQKQEAVAAGLLIEKDGGFFDRFRGRIMFPLFDVHGRVVGFTGRIIDATRLEQSREAVSLAKYVNSPETPIYSKSQLIYGLHLAKKEIRKSGEVVVVEGNVDVITCHEAGFGNVVGTSGTAFNQGQYEILKRFSSTLTFALDVDAAGWEATKRQLEFPVSLGFNVKVITIPAELAKDPDELIRKYKSQWEGAYENRARWMDYTFKKLFDKIDLNSFEAKDRARMDFLELISILPDSLERNHYIKMVADRLGDLEKDLLTDVNEYRQNRVSKFQVREKKPIRPRTKQEILERRALGLLLKFAKNLQTDWENFQAQAFTTPVLREIFNQVAILVRQGQGEIETFRQANPAHASEIDLLVFAVENELAFLEDMGLPEVKREFFLALKAESLKRHMKEVSARIRTAEQLGKLDEAKTLSGQFNDLVKELSKYG